MTTQLAKYHSSVPAEWYGNAGQLTDDQKAVITAIAKGASETELKVFWGICERYALDPFDASGQVWFVKRSLWNPRTQQEEDTYSVQIGVAGLRLIAARTGEYQGEIGPEWSMDGKHWERFWLPAIDGKGNAVYPAIARCAAVRKGFREPLWAYATWAESAQLHKSDARPDRNGKVRYRAGDPMSLWAAKPAFMLGKVSEAQALKRAFPAELGKLSVRIDMEEDQPAHFAIVSEDAQEEAPPAPRHSLPAASVNDLFDPQVMNQTEPVAVQTAPPTQPPAAGPPPAAGGSAAGSTSAAAQQRSEEIARQTGHQGDPTSFWKLSRKYGLSQQTVGEKLGVGSMLAWLNADKTRTWADAEAALRAVMGPLPGEEPAAPPQPATAPGGNGITEDQAVRLTQLAEGKHGLDHYGTRAVCLGLFDSKPRELTAEQADQLITYLEQAEPVDIALAFGNGAELREAEAAQEIAADAEAALEDPAAARAAQA